MYWCVCVSAVMCAGECISAVICAGECVLVRLYVLVRVCECGYMCWCVC